MPAAEVDRSESVGETWKQYAPGAVNCIADGPNGRCARRIVMLALGDLSPCVDKSGTNRTLTGLPLGYIHDAHVQSFTTTAACIVYW